MGVYLFGSKMTGDDTPASDIDVLVLVENAANEVRDKGLRKNNLYNFHFFIF
jgi:predicted nucleotidyltransferase